MIVWIQVLNCKYFGPPKSLSFLDSFYFIWILNAKENECSSQASLILNKRQVQEVLFWQLSSYLYNA